MAGKKTPREQIEKATSRVDGAFAIRVCIHVKTGYPEGYRNRKQPGWPCNNLLGNNQSTTENGRTLLAGPQSRLFFVALDIIKQVRQVGACAREQCASDMDDEFVGDVDLEVECVGSKCDNGDQPSNMSRDQDECGSLQMQQTKLRDSARDEKETRKRGNTVNGTRTAKKKKLKYGKEGARLGW
eukprot:SAG31_NODE_2803_length_5072_cov_3.559421_4_plen_184_part_00